MTKSISVILIIGTMLMWSGCYETVLITKDSASQLDGDQDITAFVDTTGSTLGYHFAKGMYSVVHDTLVGSGTVMTNMGEESANSTSIPVSRIAYIETEKLDLLRTMLLAGTAVVAVTLVIFSTSPGANASGPSGSGPQQGR
ncbi:MAG: hypothetical protein ACLP05_04245 [Candidatus Kryptoniota bacterium]